MPRRTFLLRHLTAVMADLHNLSCKFQNLSRLPVLGLVLGLGVQVEKDKKIIREPSEDDEAHTLRPNSTSRDLAALGTQPLPWVSSEV